MLHSSSQGTFHNGAVCHHSNDIDVYSSQIKQASSYQWTHQMETLCSMTMPGQTHKPFYPGTQFYHAFVFPCVWYEVFLSLCVLNCNSMNLMDICSKEPCGSVSMHTKETFITYYNLKTNTSFLKNYYLKIPRNINKLYSIPLQKQSISKMKKMKSIQREEEKTWFFLKKDKAL